MPFLRGILFFAFGVVGLLRFPDFYTRLHAAGKSDSLGSVLIVTGFALYSLKTLSAPAVLVAIKIFFIALFIFIASPTATHAITQTAMSVGVKPWEKGEKRR
jgi:multicomponent Na+:H+ antiporter subunit G